VGAMVGLDLAHAVGNVRLNLHDWDVDFAAWCTYKYLNSGPGGVGGAFVHERHLGDAAPPRLAGWWGTDPATRFEMENTFRPIPTAEAWQLSNAPILAMAALSASLEIFDEVAALDHDGVAMNPIVEKSRRMASHFDQLLADHLSERVETITPTHPAERGAQRSLRILGTADGRQAFEHLERSGVACDWRHPDVIRVAPTALYNRFSDVEIFVERLTQALDTQPQDR